MLIYVLFNVIMLGVVTQPPKPEADDNMLHNTDFGVKADFCRGNSD